MKITFPLLLVCCLCQAWGHAQASDHVWLETSQLKVRVNADGRLFCDDEKGAFLVPNGDTVTTLMRGASLWFSGIDQGLNLSMSVQVADSLHSDFAPGFMGIPNSGKVWKVTRNDIQEHLEDYADNWHIDNPNPAVYAWPGHGNPFFFDYNGFELPDSLATAGWYYPRYDPAAGMYPYFNPKRWEHFWHIPTEMAFFALHTDHPRLLSKAHSSIPLQIWVTVAVFDCPQNELLSRSVFVHYRWQRRIATYNTRWDSCFVSVLNDIDIGDPNDDYHGFLPGQSTYFAYNATDQDEEWGTHSPIVFASTIWRPLSVHYSHQYNDYDYLASEMGLMPYPHARDSTTPPAIAPAMLPHEYYNYATGSWRDETPLTPRRNGYNPGQANLVPTNTAFPGFPDAPMAWTEPNENNLPGNRRALVNHELVSMFPAFRNEMMLQYSYAPWTPGTYTQRIEAWSESKYELMNQMIFHFDNYPAFKTCEFVHPRIPDTPPAWQVFPNPATDVLKVWNPLAFLSKIQLYDVWGRLVGTGVLEQPAASINVQHLPNGIYLLHMESHSGQWKTVKVVVARP